ncbi:hypothetical protein SERLADRAFT_438928 [Serpula lacrymans var. lacrymans S7.9]|uniref:Uncharacterized protein n=2 Tax=Serpula lacrymans var. lacrymans TaxID=341189 RepID=F8NYE2_SERL9|nr:uncharacterized protein SERLADRAFT_438928 [Serpula lacrymans var. lacrymans S7.9]EGO23613.1 hypothetical protein SERLADRAFT_438928 [Serpula lacrymans var. lacrymans S7.9]
MSSNPLDYSFTVNDDDLASSVSASISSTPTPTASLPGQLHRSQSHSSHWSATDTPHHHHQGTSYFPVANRPASPSVRLPAHPSLVRSMSASSAKRRARSSSLSSSRAHARGYRDNGATLSEEDEGSDNGSASDRDDEENRADRGKASALAISAAGDDEEDEDGSDREDDPITVKDRQSLINVEHPFGLRIWKPALYKKSRSVTRDADAALHSVPSAQAERHFLPGNIFWVVCFGWWLAVSCFSVSALLYCVPKGGKRYSNLVFGLGWYVAWPFGKYVEGDGHLKSPSEDEESRLQHDDVDGPSLSRNSTITPSTVLPQHSISVSQNSATTSESTPLFIPSDIHSSTLPPRTYGATHSSSQTRSSDSTVVEHDSSDWLGQTVFWAAFVLIIAPLMLIACVACWGLIVPIPMAKLNWALIQYIFAGPTKIRFCAAPPAVVVSAPAANPVQNAGASDNEAIPPLSRFSVKHPRLSEGQVAPSPSGSPTSTVLLCVYKAIGLQYYKYTVGGVNIIFINLLPFVFFVIFDGFVLLPLVERHEAAGRHVPALLEFLASRALIFIMSLASVIPLSYFIGMAVASISAQSSIGMGAVINATFGSLIEIILYSIALTQGKGHLVEGSIVGSLLAGVLLMPGMSMCSGALRKKEQKFNAKSAGVTSMMLIMAFIGTLTPTLFYQTYGNFQLVCSGCPGGHPGSSVTTDHPWKCDYCYYQHPDPVEDPFYQSTVKSLMYFCAAVLLFSYLIGLWFSLRTHASQIWQNPQQLLQPLELPGPNRLPGYQRPAPGSSSAAPTIYRDTRGLRHKPSVVTNAESESPSRCQTPTPRPPESPAHLGVDSRVVFDRRPPSSPSMTRRVSYAPQATGHNYTPLLESVDLAIKNNGLQPMQFSEALTTDEFTRAVAVATVSALRHQQTHAQSPARLRSSAVVTEVESHGAHEGPAWSRTTSAAVLLGCTALYAIIAELLVDVVDVVLQGSGIDEKFLGITLFALVPNTTEFMNAISFAINGNIALSMEIGSAYALQVCLLQIPAMVAFSAWYAPDKMGEVATTFTLIFPRWDVVVIILSVFLMTYTYIEAKSNYHRGSILILSYLVLASGFYFAPQLSSDREETAVDWNQPLSAVTQMFSFLRS